MWTHNFNFISALKKTQSPAIENDSQLLTIKKGHETKFKFRNFIC